LNNDSSKIHEGVRIGLEIAKKKSELMGGELRIESELNRGTSILFSLPVSGK